MLDKVSAAQASAAIVCMLEVPAVVMSTATLCTIAAYCQQAQVHLAGAAVCTEFPISASMLEKFGCQHQVPTDTAVVAW